MRRSDNMHAQRNNLPPAGTVAGPAEGGFGSDLAEAVQWTVGGLALLTLIAYQFPGPHQQTIAEVVRVSVSIILEAMPFMLVGALVGGVIEVFVSGERLARLLAGRSVAAVFVAGALGLVFPVCDCAVVPVVRRLLRKGIPVSAAVAFLLGGPLVNPLVAASTLVAYRYNWQIVLARLGIGYAIAVIVGLVMGILFKNQQSLLADGAIQNNHNHDHNHEHDHDEHDHDHEGCCESDHAEPARLAGSWRSRLPTQLVESLRHASDDFLDMGRFLVVGALIAGCLRGAIGQKELVAVATRPGVAIPAMMAFAYLLTLCSEADAFIAAPFNGVAGMHPLVPLSAQMAFLLLSPMLDIKLTLMYTKLFRKRALVVLMILIVTAVFSAAMAFRWLTGGA